MGFIRTAVKRGRPVKFPEPVQQAIARLLALGVPSAALAAAFKVGNTTINRYGSKRA